MSVLHVIDEHECLQLLHATHLGRLGFCSASLPVILPVNYAVDHADNKGRDGSTRIVFSTDAASILSAAISGDVACLEIDDHDAFAHTGWSVLVTGRLGELGEREADQVKRRLSLPGWRPMPFPHVLELGMDMISGRRLSP